MREEQPPPVGTEHPWDGGRPYWGGPPWLRGRRRDARRFPVVSSLAVAFAQLIGSTAVGRHQTGRVHLDALGYLLLLIGPAFLAVRQRAPGLAVYGTAAAIVIYIAAGFPYGPVFLSLIVAVYSAIIRGRRRDAWIGMGIVYAGHLLIGHWLYRWLPPPGSAPAAWGPEWGIACWLFVLGAATELVRVRREQFARMRRERAEAERRRTDEERLRIARELHDVIAHSLSVINVQAGVGLELIDERPEQARTALVTIKAASKQALGEVRQVLGTLRAQDAAPREPAPGLGRLRELTGHATAAGLDVEITVEGEERPLPPGADLAAFRIVQEALTNIIRHSQARTARVLIGYLPGAVELRVDDDGPAVTGGTSGGGNGLVGMRERAAALGGTVTAGPRDDGGFRVDARLPVPGTGGVWVPGRSGDPLQEER
ncbi:sensor histidine kinase [Streptomyces sp. RB6PN25]|uniref:histidine kinase n=1 Tax=Streptomyces humicola TaxID=2953240 RepID=A0ABT1Q143_9ACTN|nr:sensor histidine kinase [Streptomyces humicola]MCQ4083616.1 sensor histidine kinase [Streptomyces humicola]